MIPKRDVITRIADEIRQVMADDYSRENQQLIEVHEQLRRRLWETTAVAIILGCAAVFLATWYAAGLNRKFSRTTPRSRGTGRICSGCRQSSCAPMKTSAGPSLASCMMKSDRH